ncbi:MAG: peptidase dimerization domain-containing protein [Candidatus Microthrix sp.]|nr:peptidase dimerization domain-containing protein [Candidatus Microthrix sp.]MBK7019591.1 peptidase dimerization domain-containing protein [Candidatus Microthrix sp.]
MDPGAQGRPPVRGGGADDGYSVYALGTALVALDRAGGEHGRIVGVIECSEESGSPDLPAHLEALGDELSSPELVVCLDSGCGDYERLWVTTSLRGLVSVDLRVDVLTEGVHSGAAGGIVPSSFRIARTLLDRIEAASDGRLLIDELFPEIPKARREQAAQSAGTLGRPPAFPWADDTHPATDDVADQLLARTWGPALEVIGADGLPQLADAGNVARPSTTLGLSIRIPPGVDPEAITARLTELLTNDPPAGATVTVSPGWGATGWDAPPTAPCCTPTPPGPALPCRRVATTGASYCSAPGVGHAAPPESPRRAPFQSPAVIVRRSVSTLP